MSTDVGFRSMTKGHTDKRVTYKGTNIPAPSPMANPSRSLSHGLEASSGLSLNLVDYAFIDAKPAIPNLHSALSAPPAIITSASSSFIVLAEVKIPCATVAHAVTAESFTK
ncbi:hypothetical protein AVEN_57855-1 [Araneus ventricosus]|uniref:Uncharacterized protein n=1 Tax=Araneus ventricosus TaxID=182803 RepID=A0A4Y2HNM7_ARAVE|nr:hypothetical protein AVEN_57855-1 [Araneus ventricosus]